MLMLKVDFKGVSPSAEGDQRAYCFCKTIALWKPASLWKGLTETFSVVFICLDFLFLNVKPIFKEQIDHSAVAFAAVGYAADLKCCIDRLI